MAASALEPRPVGAWLRAAAIVLLCSAIPLPAHSADYLELTRLRLIDGSGSEPREVIRLLVRDGRVIAIDETINGDRSEMAEAVVAPNDRWTRIDLDGAWVMPGLIDTHVHVARFPDAFAQAERILREALRGGVTAVRDLAGDARALAELERRATAENALLPEVGFSALFGGPDIFDGGPTSAMASGRPPGDASWAQRVTDDTDLPRAVAQAYGSGARHIKLYGDLRAELAARVIREAHRQDMQTVAHATVFPARPSDLVAAGIGTLSHAPYLVWEAVDEVPADYGARIRGPWDSVPPDHPRLLALYRQMASRGVILDATLFVYRSMHEYLPPQVDSSWTRPAFEWAVQATRLAHRAGVPISVGTDWFEGRDGGLPHTHDELAILVQEVGLSPLEAISAGTRNGARAMGIEQTHGTTEIGKIADLLVLDAHPLQDIANTRRLRMVIRRGMVVEGVGR